MARIADIKWNDTGNGPGINVSVFMQGCPFHCDGCFNQSTWDFSGGVEATSDTIVAVLEGLEKNGVHRNLSVLGGEPLAYQNKTFVQLLVKFVKKKLPTTKIWLWTGYEISELSKIKQDPELISIFKNIDCMVVGRFILAEKDLSLRYMGSRNQKIIDMTKTTDISNPVYYEIK